MSICPIAEVEVLLLRANGQAERDQLDSAAETVVVRITDEVGRTGIGEADSASPAVRSLILMDDAHSVCRGLRNILIGQDPVQTGALWDKMVSGTLFIGEGGVVRHAIAAVDIALHDLAGKQLERPAFHLLGGVRRDHLTPYATLYAGSANGRSLNQLIDALSELLARALNTGFRAVKYEALFEDLATDRQVVECIREARRQIGDDITLLVDFGYRWHDWRDALWTLNRLEDCNIWLAEATLQHSDLHSHAKLAERVETRIGGGEFASSLQECRAWIEVGRVDCLQPDVARAGGLTEMRRIAELASLYGIVVVPHCWKTGINFAAACHAQAATANMPFIEMFAAGFFPSPLREMLVYPEPRVVNGCIDLPNVPGLGIALSEDFLLNQQVINYAM